MPIVLPADHARAGFTATLSAPHQEPGFIWICNWCNQESESPVTRYADIETDYQAHTCYAYAKWKAHTWAIKP